MRVLFSCLLLAVTVRAATWVAADATRNSVQAVIDAGTTVDGDTVQIPAGTETWTAGISTSKAITLQGAGIGNTVITDGMTAGALVNMTLVNAKVSRITGIKWLGSESRTTPTDSPFVIHGTYSVGGGRLRVDHCYFKDLRATFFRCYAVLGVIDHNEVVNQDFHVGFSVLYGTESSQHVAPSDDEGDANWSEGVVHGSEKALFIEDNTMTCLTGWMGGVSDGYGGCRFVIRNNTFTDYGVFNHGTESTGRKRGGLLMDVLDNTFTLSLALTNVMVNYRSGTGNVTGNHISGYQLYFGGAAVNLNNFRMNTSEPSPGWAPYGQAIGTSEWDYNQAGGPFYSGTASSTTATTLTVSPSPGWSTNQWAGYSVKQTSGTVRALGSTIQSSTADTLTFQGTSYFFGDFVISAGNTFEIYRVVHVLDGVGRVGGGNLGGEYVPVRPWASGQNDQATDPLYVWGNTGEPVVVGKAFPDSMTLVEGTHYIVGTARPGFTGYAYPHPLIAATEGGGSSNPSPIRPASRGLISRRR